MWEREREGGNEGGHMNADEILERGGGQSNRSSHREGRRVITMIFTA